MRVKASDLAMNADNSAQDVLPETDIFDAPGDILELMDYDDFSLLISDTDESMEIEDNENVTVHPETSVHLENENRPAAETANSDNELHCETVTTQKRKASDSVKNHPTKKTRTPTDTPSPGTSSADTSTPGTRTPTTPSPSSPSPSTASSSTASTSSPSSSTAATSTATDTDDSTASTGGVFLPLTASSKIATLEILAMMNGIEMEIKFVNGQVQLQLLLNGARAFPTHRMIYRAVSSYATTREEILCLEKFTVSDQLDVQMPCLMGTAGMNVWFCPLEYCDQAFYRYGAARLHTLVHLKFRPYKCKFPDCKWSFYTPARLQRHAITHIERTNYSCSEYGCEQRFNTVYKLKCHQRTHERPRNHVCLCANSFKTFSMPKHRNQHLQTHGRPGALYECHAERCDKRFYMAPSLTKHLRIHAHKREEIRCNFPHCGRMFDKQSHLEQHRQLHTGLNPFVCTFGSCTRAFMTSIDLKQHLASHPNENEFRCTNPDCNQIFFTLEQLLEHYRTHAVNTPSDNNEESLLPSEAQIDLTESLNTLVYEEVADTLLRQAIESLEDSSASMGIYDAVVRLAMEGITDMLPEIEFQRFI